MTALSCKESVTFLHGPRAARCYASGHCTGPAELQQEGKQNRSGATDFGAALRHHKLALVEGFISGFGGFDQEEI